ncbi:hypothetical protein [Candidatus Odyssella acanthamoebae]|uniref:Uncharacterized protein n=1 Tax=Candidatus Odyssella acanthamoebae TaxID=91604 RepID=A0A077AWC4_9PROT|nr:hypothetical protein [Candidatus Paracaedibacter acanthamoebae]AIK95928.1 hypothetical protein ID47_03020 [Candidatus Paracaedibacter acanthamoebae]
MKLLIIIICAWIYTGYLNNACTAEITELAEQTELLELPDLPEPNSGSYYIKKVQAEDLTLLLELENITVEEEKKLTLPFITISAEENLPSPIEVSSIKKRFNIASFLTATPRVREKKAPKRNCESLKKETVPSSQELEDVLEKTFKNPLYKLGEEGLEEWEKPASS